MLLHSDFGERTINELQLMFRNGQINLNPGFQRKSVWGVTNRRRLIQSIVANYPLPSVFLYKREHNGRLIYDVIDGKQRLETIFMFTRQGRFARDCFDVPMDLGEGLEWADFKTLVKYRPDIRVRFESYKIQTAEVSGELQEIIDLFVRINSTGKPLTSGEKRHAKFFESRFLKEADRLVRKHQRYLLKEKVLTPAQLDRMKGTELFAELLMSLHHGGIINKKTSLDRAIGNDAINAHTLAKLVREFTSTLNTLKRLIPNLRQTRFHNTADYYSRFMLSWELRQNNYVLNDKKRNTASQAILVRLSNGVDALRDRLRKLKAPTAQQRVFADYLLTVQGDTDSSSNRQRRAEILRNLLAPLLAFKDDQRTFTSEQRRLLWSSDERKQCKKCGEALTWENVTIDHVFAYAKGGKATRANAQLLCRPCNSRKGAR